MLNFGASKPRVRGGARAPGAPPLDPHLKLLSVSLIMLPQKRDNFNNVIILNTTVLIASSEVPATFAQCHSDLQFCPDAL